MLQTLILITIRIDKTKISEIVEYKCNDTTPNNYLDKQTQTLSEIIEY